jgi:hypothetical protein
MSLGVNERNFFGIGHQLIIYIPSFQRWKSANNLAILFLTSGIPLLEPI